MGIHQVQNNLISKETEHVIPGLTGDPGKTLVYAFTKIFTNSFLISQVLPDKKYARV